MLYSCDICTLTYAGRHDHAASRRMWTNALQVIVSRLSPLSGMHGKRCRFHALRPELQVPDDERAGRVKARVQDKLTIPFSADKEW